ncbi:MAG: DUF2149 domain-containing protein [Methylocystaceae bacterium]|nr:DUF2149 domain-containing protein [Methylocystaceae bacterium]
MLLEEDESNNPMLSVVNLVDLFLVIIAALLIFIAQNPLNPFQDEDVIVIKNPGKKNMEMMIKKGEKIEKYESDGQIGQGNGIKAGVAYRMEDGSIVYVPEGEKEGEAPK